MSRYSYAGDFVNPADTWRVASKPDASRPEGVVYFVEVYREEDREIDGVSGKFSFWSPHTSGHEWDEHEQADEWVEATGQAYEGDYDDYLEENRHEIAAMERYEAWRNEY